MIFRSPAVFMTYWGRLPSVWQVDEEMSKLNLVLGNFTWDLVLLNCIYWVKWILMYFIGRLYFQSEKVLRDQCKSFDVRKAHCEFSQDKDILLKSIRDQFGDFQNHDIDKNLKNIITKPVSNPLEDFNKSVKRLLKKQTVSSSRRILPYSLVVVAYFAQWFSLNFNYRLLPTTGLWDQNLPWSTFSDFEGRWDHLDFVFYKTLWSKPFYPSNLGPIAPPFDSMWGYYWYDILIFWPYRIFVRYPLVFYLESLIIKALFRLENNEKWKVPWYFCWIPVIFLFAVLEETEKFIFDQFVHDGLAFFFGVSKYTWGNGVDGSKSAIGVPLQYSPFKYLFDCFGTSWPAPQGHDAWGKMLENMPSIALFSIKYSTGFQVLAFLIWISAAILVLFVHESCFLRKTRRSFSCFLKRKFDAIFKFNKSENLDISAQISVNVSSRDGGSSYSKIYSPGILKENAKNKVSVLSA